MQIDHKSMQNLQNSADMFLSGAFARPFRDEFIRIRVSRNTLIAIALSLIIHALIFFVPKISFDTPPLEPATTIVVSLAEPSKLPSSQSEVPASMPEVVPTEPRPIEKPKAIKPKVIKPIKQLEPNVLAVPSPVPDRLPPKEPDLKDAPVTEKFTDMASYVKAMQAKRQGADYEAARQNAEAAAREKVPSEEQLRDERIKRNLQNGTNGIFEITSLGSRNATFAFRGWTNDYSSSKRQFFEVEAAPGQDVRLVMIRRMIALIREHYDGNFQWESHRLGRSVTQSARLEDSAGLEDFLMMEFFGSNYRSTY